MSHATEKNTFRSITYKKIEETLPSILEHCKEQHYDSNTRRIRLLSGNNISSHILRKSFVSIMLTLYSRKSFYKQVPYSIHTLLKLQTRIEVVALLFPKKFKFICSNKKLWIKIKIEAELCIKQLRAVKPTNYINLLML